MIQPGLERISLLLKDVTFPWKAIHVAGTNGKGSICHVATTLLRRRAVRVGQFTSPHLVDRWDCISINNTPVQEDVFKKLEKHYSDLNIREQINASSFEILTACAFTLFNRANVDIGVIEVGMGGTLDATNILNNQAVSVISKIAKDHEAFLGNTLEEIAKHKAGILRPSVPYIVNPMNEQNVHNVIDNYAKEISAGPRLTGDTPKLRQNLYSLPDWRSFATRLLPFQRDNVVLAIIAVKEALRSIGKTISNELIADELNKKRIQKPGRFAFTAVRPVFGHGTDQEILVDGAHNPDAAIALNDFMSVQRRFKRTKEQIPPPSGGWPVTWVLAMTEGKDASQYLRTILKPGDNVITTSFGPVDGMPWVKCMDPKALLNIAQSVQDHITGLAMPIPGPMRALCAAKHLSMKGQPIVLTGSLYFVGDLHRELRGRNDHDYWKMNAHDEDKRKWVKILQEERERVNRLLSGQDTDFIPEPDDTEQKLQVASRKQSLQEQIEALDKEMDLLAIKEMQLLIPGFQAKKKKDPAEQDAVQKQKQPGLQAKKGKPQPPTEELQLRSNADSTDPVQTTPTSRPFTQEMRELGEKKKHLEELIKNEQDADAEFKVAVSEMDNKGTRRRWSGSRESRDERWGKQGSLRRSRSLHETRMMQEEREAGVQNAFSDLEDDGSVQRSDRPMGTPKFKDRWIMRPSFLAEKPARGRRRAGLGDEQEKEKEV